VGLPRPNDSYPAAPTCCSVRWPTTNRLLPEVACLSARRVHREDALVKAPDWAAGQLDVAALVDLGGLMSCQPGRPAIGVSGS
jgi:hypothetical protein